LQDAFSPLRSLSSLIQVRAALAASGGRLTLLGSPWSPPAWMKSNHQMNGNGAPIGLRREAAASWANFITRWLSAFAAHGASVSWLTVQNEPLAPSPWEACYFNSTQEAHFIARHLGPALAASTAARRHPPVQLLGFDDQKGALGT
jgi:glucosylceramidase